MAALNRGPADSATPNALNWTSSVRLANFQIASAFEQCGDIVTTALPQFSGSAALRSTLALYIRQQRMFSGEIPAGPFHVRSLPYVSGGDVRLVATDATGRQVERARYYYYVPGQLCSGLLEYSVDVGVPRLEYGLNSFSYDDAVFASASVRYGLTESTTVEGHVEASSDKRSPWPSPTWAEDGALHHRAPRAVRRSAA